MYTLSFSRGDIDFLREVAEFIDEIIDAVEIQDELKHRAQVEDCE